MSLTAGRGPLAPNPAGRFSEPVAEGLVYIEPHPRRIEAIRGGVPVIVTEHALLVHRAGQALSYVFPADEIGADLPTEAEPDAPGYVRVPWTAVDEWYEEGRRLVHYPPNPYHRVDGRPTTRQLTVTVGDTVIVDTDDTVIVFETALDPVLYVDRTKVVTGSLRRTSTESYCNYKGVATYWAIDVGDTSVEDAAWSYEDPLPESRLIAGLLAFDRTKVGVAAALPTERATP